MSTELKYTHNLVWWKSLDFKWKKQIYLNYRLSHEDISWRIRAFLDDSYGLDFIMCKIFNIESDNPNDDLLKLDLYVNNEILKINETAVANLQSIEEIVLQDIDNLKPLEYLPNLKLVYLDHCKIQDINILKNIDKLSFYEVPECPTNTPSLYHNSDVFNKKVKIILNPFVEVKEYFNKITNAE